MPVLVVFFSKGFLVFVVPMLEVPSRERLLPRPQKKLLLQYPLVGLLETYGRNLVLLVVSTLSLKFLIFDFPSGDANGVACGRGNFFVNSAKSGVACSAWILSAF